MLTVLQQKVAEAHGLALSATVVTQKVGERIDVPALRDELERLRREAEETRARCVDYERLLPAELTDELRAHAVSTHESGADLVGAWFKAGTDPLRAWLFLAMGEAAEVAVWSALEALATRAGDGAAMTLAAWALPVQTRHLATVLDGSVLLSHEFDPSGPRWG